MKFSLIIALSVLLLQSQLSQAQIIRVDTIRQSTKLKQAPYKSQELYIYTIGIKTFSVEEFPRILNQTNEDEFLNTAMSGVFLKLNDNQISYRISASLFSKNMSFENDCKECEEVNGKLKDFSARSGFEKNFNYGLLQPYFAFDIGYRRTSFEGNGHSVPSLGFSNPYEVSTLKNGFLMSPNFGLKINVISHITISAEAGLDLLYSYEKQEKVYQDASRNRTFNEYKKWEFLLKPLTMLSIQYNFGPSF